MKAKIFSIIAIVALLAGISPGTAMAGAYETDFVTSITYQNIGTMATTTLNVLFYENPADTVAQTVARDNLAAGASTSLYIGSVIFTTFEGTAVLSADQPMAAALVQTPPGGAAVKVRPLSIGFKEGAPQTTVPTVRKNDGGEHTVFVVQNAGTCQANASIRFYDLTGLRHTMNQVIESGAGVHVDAATIGAIGTTFNGSVVVDGTCVGGGTPAFVSSAIEFGFGASNAAKAFEGGQGVAGPIYMPSALCSAGAPPSTSYYAVQNTGTVPTNITVNYSNGRSETKAAAAGQKASFGGCAPATMPTGFSGSATITSSAAPIMAVGKVANVPAGQLTTAFNGVAVGAQKIALPYVRWANSAHYFAGVTQRTYIAIQNIGGNIPNGQNIVVQYVNPAGVVEGTHTITGGLAAGAKTNSTPTSAGLTEFGCASGCTTFGGGAIITGPAGSQLAVVARLTTWNGFADVADDYNGIPYP